jgi:prevent-host-death family protein
MTNMAKPKSALNIAEAKARLSELVRRASLGEEVVIAKDNKPLVKLVPLRPMKAKRQPGSGKGEIAFMARDFDTTPESFEAYLPDDDVD